MSNLIFIPANVDRANSSFNALKFQKVLPKFILCVDHPVLWLCCIAELNSFYSTLYHFILMSIKIHLNIKKRLLPSKFRESSQKIYRLISPYKNGLSDYTNRLQISIEYYAHYCLSSSIILNTFLIRGH